MSVLFSAKKAPTPITRYLLDERSLYFSLAPNRAIPTHKSIRSFPLAAAHPLTVLPWPEALDASGSRRACLMHIGPQRLLSRCSP